MQTERDFLREARLLLGDPTLTFPVEREHLVALNGWCELRLKAEIAFHGDDPELKQQLAAKLAHLEGRTQESA